MKLLSSTSEPLVTKTSNYSLSTSDSVVLASGTITMTLPTAVGITGQAMFIKNNGTGMVTVATTSSQTIDGVATNLTLSQGQYACLQSDGANWWTVDQGPAIQPLPCPQVGWWLTPFQQMGQGSATAFTATQSGQCTFMPIIIAQSGMSFSTIGVGSTVAESGGTTAHKAGVYASLPDLSGPDRTQLITSASIALTGAAGNQTTALSSTWSPQPGVYWVAFLYLETVAPTTRATLRCLSNAASTWGIPNSQTIGDTGPRYLSQTGLSALPTTNGTALTGSSGSTGAVVGVKRSA